MEGALLWLMLSRAPAVGRIRLANLMAACPDPADVPYLTVSDLLQVEGWNRPACEGVPAVLRNARIRQKAEEEWSRAQQAGMRLVCLSDPDYPLRLRLTPDPPPYFWQVGPWQPDARPAVAIVGSRKPTAYGLAVAERFGYDLAQMGAVVISGMAKGIDCAAHRGALQAGGTTVAVLGGGADVCYPREAAPVYRQIQQTGAIISEQPPGTAPRSEHFPERNRIISGLAHGILVVEAGEKSGTLITVSEAAKQGRDVFAIPGPITSPMSFGPHELIRDGACLVYSARQVLEELGFAGVKAAEPASHAGLTPNEQRVLTWMAQEPRWAGDLAEASGLSASEVQGILTLLELRTLVRQVPGGQYIRIG